MPQEFRDAGVAIARGVERLVVHGTGDDGIHFAGERKAGSFLYSLAGRASCVDVTQPVPGSLLPAPDDADISSDRLGQRLFDDLRSNATRVPAGYGQAGAASGGDPVQPQVQL